MKTETTHQKPPLLGRKILITRPRPQAQAFSQLLRSLGAEPIEFPTIQIVPPPSWEPLDRAIAALSTYQWIIFTSANGVQQFLARLSFHGQSPQVLRNFHLCAIGPATAAALTGAGLQVELVPEEYRAEAICTALRQKTDLSQTRILLPRAMEARAVLVERLREAGATVDVVPAYRSIKPSVDTGSIKQMLRAGEIAVITFTSSSTVRNFVSLFSEEDLSTLLQGVRTASIGPITTETMRQMGIEPDIVAREYTIPALAQAIVDYFTRSS